MTRIERLVRAVPETYALNLAQVFHMLLLAGLVPWLIGVEAYGRFAALIALPGTVQSAFEAFAVVILAKYGRRDMLDWPILRVMLPIALAFALAFFVLLAPGEALLASIMTVLLFSRSYAFAIAISSGGLTRQIMESEGLILVAYVLVILAGFVLGIRNQTLPVLMVIAGSLLSTWYLLRSTQMPQILLPRRPDVSRPALPLGMALRGATARAYEDGLLTLSPLVLAAVGSASIAGQFRIFVSVVKVAYKLFPYRYEVVMRDVISGRQRFKSLALASAAFAVGSLVVAAVGYLALRPQGYAWLAVLVGATGAVVASLALYPVSSTIEPRMPFAFLAGLMATFALAWLYGVAGFVVGFTVTSYAVMIASLVIIRTTLRRQVSA